MLISYKKGDSKLVNLKYVIMISEYFNNELFYPFMDYLKSIRNNKRKNKTTIRTKLLIFLVKSKIIIKLIDNCKNTRPNDIFALKKTSKIWSSFEENITKVYLGSDEECKKEYKMLGTHLQKVFISILNSNDITLRPEDCLDLVRNPNYFEEIITFEKIKFIESKSGVLQKSGIIKPTIAFNYVGNLFNKNVSDETELHFCFPNPEFLFEYYKLIDSKWTKIGMNILSTGSSVASFSKMFEGR